MERQVKGVLKSRARQPCIWEEASSLSFPAHAQREAVKTCYYHEFNSRAPKTSDYLKLVPCVTMESEANCCYVSNTTVGSEKWPQWRAEGPSAGSWLPATRPDHRHQQLKYPLWGCTQDKNCGWAESSRKANKLAQESTKMSATSSRKTKPEKPF